MMKKILIILVSFLLSNSYYEGAHAKTSYFEEGKKLFDNKQFKDSKFYFEKNIVFNPKSEKSYLYLAKIFNKEQKNTLEEENLNTVILLNPLNEEAIYLLTILNIEKSNFSKAKELMSTMASVCKKMCPKKKELQEKLNNAQQSK